MQTAPRSRTCAGRTRRLTLQHLRSSCHETCLSEHTVSLLFCQQLSCSPTPLSIVKCFLDSFLGQQQAHMSTMRFSAQLYFSRLGSRPHNIWLRDHETLACLHSYRVSHFVGMQIAEHMTFDPVAMEYYPTIFFNDFWLLKDYLIPMNETVTEVPLSFTLSTMTLWKFTLFSQMDQAFGKQVCSLDSSHSYCSPC